VSRFNIYCTRAYIGRRPPYFLSRFSVIWLLFYCCRFDEIFCTWIYLTFLAKPLVGLRSPPIGLPRESGIRKCDARFQSFISFMAFHYDENLLSSSLNVSSCTKYDLYINIILLCYNLILRI